LNAHNVDKIPGGKKEKPEKKKKSNQRPSKSRNPEQASAPEYSSWVGKAQGGVQKKQKSTARKCTTSPARDLF